MGAHYVLNRYMVLIMVMCISMNNGLVSQHLNDNTEYIVEASCVSPFPDKPTQESQYYYLLTISDMESAEEHFEIVVDGQALTQFHVSEESLPYNRIVGPFTHSGVGGSYHEYILRSLESTISDTLYLSELVCGYSTSNGLNRAGYYCSGSRYGVIAQTAPEEFMGPQLPEKTYVYTLIHRASGIVRSKNFSGHFEGVEDLENYEIHAFATSFEESSTFINNIIIGQELDQSNLSFCYGLCGVFPVDVDCSSFDLALEKKVRGGLVHSIGDTVVYDIIITNQGRVTAYNIAVTDVKPDVLMFIPTLNPEWNSDLTSKEIPELAAGASFSIPIAMIIGQTGGLVEVVNTAEIIKATDSSDKDVTAFDVDSTPGNKTKSEDDQDDALIVIVENLCDATFRMRLMKEPVCAGAPILMSAMIEMSNGDLKYYWQYEGEEISRDSILVIPNHTVANYGTYALTVVDTMGCTGTEFITIEPIDNSNRASCFSDIYVGINEKCQMFLRPSMFTNRTVSAIDDYIIEIRDEDGLFVDQSNLWKYASGTTLEGRLINPCTNEVLCWSNLHIEHKSRPKGNILSTVYTTTCGEVYSENPTSIIENYVAAHPNTILAAHGYADSLNQLSCLQEWDVEVSDSFIEASSTCDNPEVHRIYSIYDQEQRINLDTTVLIIDGVEIASIVGPEDVDNLKCGAGYEANALSSFPYYISHGDTILLKGNSENGSNSLCQVGVTYSDQYIGENCNFGVNKIMRAWSVSDWCANEIFQSLQFIYIVDNVAPESEEMDTILLEVAPFACAARLDLSQHITVIDDCDQEPNVFIKGYEEKDLIDDYQLGIHSVVMNASDRCGNKSEFSVVVKVVENTPPAAVLNQDIVIGISEEPGPYTNYVLASHVDAESHDHGCGPVEVTIARLGEVSIIKGSGGSISIESDLYNCSTEDSKWDENDDGRIALSEIYRDSIVFCCQDIGMMVPISVRVRDMSGNITYAETNIEVQAKREYTNCDDGDPCTMNDRAYGECPCRGSLELRDEDEDDIVDCQDDAIQFCHDGASVIVAYPQIDSMLALGAVGGSCSGASETARIAGTTETPQGAMIQNVVINSNYQLSVSTGESGNYVFTQNPMYRRYELSPYKNDDALNGVSSLDLLILQEYLIGLRPLTDPYIQIAADINNDGQITSLDLVDLRKVLLGYESEFPSNDSWRFIIKDFEWADIKNPFDFEEINVISSLDKDYMNEDWLGVKIGDLSGDALANARNEVAKIRSSKELTMNTKNRRLSPGDKHTLSFTTSRSETLKAIQIGMIADGLKITGVQSQVLSLSPEHIALTDEESALSIVWFDDQAIQSDKILFELEIEATEEGMLSEMLSLDQDLLQSVYYNSALHEGDILLNFTQEDLSQEQSPMSKMYQNQPNPFNGETLIQFELPRAGNVRFEFYSVDGKSLYAVEDEFGEGINALTIRPLVFDGYSGIVYYQMKFGNEQHTKTMVVNRD